MVVGLRMGGAAHAIVFLAALTTEHERQQYATPVSRNELLAVDANIACIFRFQRRIDGITAANKLVQTKGKGMKALLWRRFTGIARQEAFLDDGKTAWLWYAGELAECRRRAIPSRNTARTRAHQTITLLFRLYAESRFNPHRQWVLDKRRIGRRGMPLGIGCVFW